ncbi:PAS domain-containing sensor histidine kinase [Anaeromyxobacter paludicola]|uniref:histidine kinase n=1 Tax=Anaeromyxobacter paludicola TaxID=2918171 RepID=A0ABM7XAA9_9BACT|nr:ATP-binding protein [Anaeromyxobacter paludicola]BDG08755.1 hypothetical protein AMPC_18680 [Anaeromyxobacter paludicola]
MVADDDIPPASGPGEPLATAIFELMPAGVALLRGEELVYEYVNPAYQAMVAGASLVGRPFGSAWVEMGDRLRPALREVLRTGRRFGGHDQPLPVRRGRGLSTAWFDFSVDRLTDPRGGPDRLLILATETTATVHARRVAEESASHSAKALRDLQAVVDALSVGVMIADPAGNLLVLNYAAAALHGFGTGEDYQLGLRELSSLFRVRDLAGRELAPEDWPLGRIVRGESFDDLEFELERPEQGWRRILSYGGRPVAGEGGRPFVNVLTIRDVTALHQAERDRRQLFERVQRQAAQLEAVLAAIADGLIIYGPSGEVLHINPAGRDTTGFGDELLERPLAARLRAGDLVDDAGRPIPIEETPAWRALRGETSRGRVVGMRRPDGQRIWHSVSAAPIRGPTGEVQGAVVSLTDVSAIRELQEQRADLIRTLSHDVRTPLNVIVNQAELLRMKPSLEGLPRRLASIATSTRRITAMIDDLVEMARIQLGRAAAQQAPVDLQAFLAELLDRLRGTLPVERVTAELPPGLPRVAADPGRLERILVNLLGNALKYSEGPVRVGARATGPNLELAVADQGRGISAEDLPRIFDRFFRAGDVGETEGIGLGLYVARSLAEAHGGTIRAESGGPGQGSVFTLVLPLAAVPAP